MTCTYGYSHFIHFKTVAIEVQIQFLSTWTSPRDGSEKSWKIYEVISQKPASLFFDETAND